MMPNRILAPRNNDEIDFADGSTNELQPAEAMSSVILRDKAGVMEYAG
jgi:hypothetical protein